MSFQTCRIGVIQLTPTHDKPSNLEISTNLIRKAHADGAKMIFLPEAFDYIGRDLNETLALAEPLGGSSTMEHLCQIARDLQVWLSLGGFHRKPSPSPGVQDENKIYNSHIVVNSQGEIASTYDKVHLFDVKIESSTAGGAPTALRESRYMMKGTNAPVFVPNSPVGCLGLGICYDMRFPEFAASLRHVGGADVLTYPSAFTVPTGEAGHWHVLLKARAIENQCYVVAAALAGKSNEKRSFYGHSIVIDPWGQVVAEKTDSEPGYFVCDINGWPENTESTTMSIKKARASIPVHQHRRHDLFPLVDVGRALPIDAEQSFRFGPVTILSECVFYRSQLSFAFVNISPLVPGHVLVSPVRCAPRFEELTLGEVTDLYATVRHVAPKISKHFGATSLTIAIQDGEDAGQSIPHVHMHILPRKPGDFPVNDDIYQALQSHDKGPDRVLREPSVMADEAAIFRKLFY